VSDAKKGKPKRLHEFTKPGQVHPDQWTVAPAFDSANFVADSGPVVAPTPGGRDDWEQQPDGTWAKKAAKA
jgi:hypothetical protein